MTNSRTRQKCHAAPLLREIIRHSGIDLDQPVSMAGPHGTLDAREASENDYYPAFAEADGSGYDKGRGGGTCGDF